MKLQELIENFDDDEFLKRVFNIIETIEIPDIDEKLILRYKKMKNLKVETAALNTLFQSGIHATLLKVKDELRKSF